MLWIVLICVLFASIELLDTRMADQEYNRFFSFNRILDKKMTHFPNKKVGWLKFYMNILLPCITFLTVKGSYNLYLTNPLFSFEFILYTVVAILFFLDLFLFRFIDSSSYTINALANLALIAEFVYALLSEIEMLAFYAFNVGIWILVVIANLSYFKARKELFLSTEKELSEKYTLL